MKTDNKKKLSIIISIIFVLIAATAIYFAMPKNKDLSESSIFDQEEIEALSEQVVDYINTEDYEGLKAMSVDEMADVMNEERMDEAKARVSEDWGGISGHRQHYNDGSEPARYNSGGSLCGGVL